MKKRVLLICDRPNWAYDAIAKAIVKYAADDDIHFDITYVKGNVNVQKEAVAGYDLLFPLGWQLLDSLSKKKWYSPFTSIDFKKCITGIHSHHAWDHRKTTPEKDVKPPKKLVNQLNRCKAVNTVSRRLFRIFQEAGVRNLYCTENGVDTDLFFEEKSLRQTGPLRVGYSGSLKHDWRKGISDFIRPACRKADVELLEAIPVEGHYQSQENIPDFYKKIDVYVCASSSEGFSLSVLEAAACGCPVISTKVGGCTDLIKDGSNGFLVDRNVPSIVAKLNLLKENRPLLNQMRKNMVSTIRSHWSWKKKIENWINFIKVNIEK